MTRPKWRVSRLSRWVASARLRSMVVLALLGAPALEGSAGAQGGAESESQAETLNSQGKVLIRQLDLVGAAKMFRAAMVLSEDPRFAFNLCYTLEKSGQLVEAKRVCEKVLESNNDRLVEKSEKLLKSIAERQEVQNRDPVADPVAEKPEEGEIESIVEGRDEEQRKPPTHPAKTNKTHFGAVAGIVLAGIEGQGDTASHVGIALGGWIRRGFLENYDLVVEAQLVRRKFSLLGIGEIMQALDFESTYIDVGASTRRRFLRTSALAPYIEGGAAVSVLVGNTVSSDAFARKTLDLSWTLSVGTEIEIAGQVADVRVHYVQGLLDSKASGSVSRGGAYNRAILMQAGFWL